MRELLRKRVSPRDVDFPSIQGWIRKDAITEGLSGLLDEMRKADPTIDENAAKKFWDDRPKKQPRRAKYGSGSRFIEPPKLLPKTGQKQPPQQHNNKNNNGPAPVIKLEDPPNKDDWWKALPAEQRIEFWWAFYVEKSGLFEVDPKREYVMCDKCQGDGKLSWTLSDGTQMEALCTRCGGRRNDIVLKYR